VTAATMQFLKRWGLRLYGAIVACTVAGIVATDWIPPETRTAVHFHEIMYALCLAALLFWPIVLTAFVVTTTGLAVYALGLVYLVPLWHRLARMRAP